MSQTLTVSQIQPLAGYVLIEPAQAETKTASGIYLPESTEKKSQHGKVLACGKSKLVDGKEVVCPVKVKDLVLYKQWGGNAIKVGEIEYQLMEFDDILAVIK